MNWNAVLTDLYYSPGKPSSYGGVEKLLKYGKRQHPNLTRKDVIEWLSGQDAYTLHKPTVQKFKRRPTVVAGPGQQLQADLLDVRSHSRDNDGMNFLLTAVDCFSRKAWVIPIRSKGGVQVAEALKKVLSEQSFRALQTDKGKEFYNSHVKELIDQLKMNHFSSENESIKASMVERFNKTLRGRVHRYLTGKTTNRFIGVLQDFVDAYNDTEHRSIGMSPNEVNSSNQHEVFLKLYESGGMTRRSKSVLSPLKEGDSVRITTARGAFERGYTTKWTTEVFTIKRVLKHERPVVYVVKDYHGERILGTFYRQELQKVAEPEAYKIENVIKSRVQNGRKQFYVKWLGYPESFNSWVDERDMM